MVTEDPRVRESVVRAVLREAAEIPFDKTPVHIGMEIHRIVRRIAGDLDPYSGIKSTYNEKSLHLYPHMKDLVEKDPDRLDAAIRIAAAGNMIDFGITSVKKEIELRRILDETMEMPFAVNDLEELKQMLKDGRRILYIADNAGEIVFDRVLIEEISDYRNRVTLVVRGHAVLNDATLRDAEQTGIVDSVRVIDNGSDAPGTILETCSRRFLEEYRESDLLISKGQGNYETLSDCGKSCCFILRAKCPVIADHFGVDVGCAIVKMVKEKSGFSCL
jgi:uncharacterized protein with ATP-grasp and redox domains